MPMILGKNEYDVRKKHVNESEVSYYVKQKSK
jgi:hypothetical protein